MRVERRSQDVLDHHQQPDPVDEARTAEQEEMREPHRVEHNNADRAPLDCDVQRLVMRIADYLAQCAALTIRGFLEKAARRSGAVTGDWGVCEEFQRLAPIDQPRSHATLMVQSFGLAI